VALALGIRRAVELRCQVLHAAAVLLQVLLIPAGRAVHLVCPGPHRLLTWRAIEDTSLTVDRLMADHRRAIPADTGAQPRLRTRRLRMEDGRWAHTADLTRAPLIHMAAATLTAVHTETTAADALQLRLIQEGLAADRPAASVAAEAMVVDSAEAVVHRLKVLEAAAIPVEAVDIQAVVDTGDTARIDRIFALSFRAKFPPLAGGERVEESAFSSVK
jgi:hypothetical protein